MNASDHRDDVVIPLPVLAGEPPSDHRVTGLISLFSGIFSLMLCLTGIGFALAVERSAIALFIVGSCVLLGCPFAVVSLITGVISRRTRTGRTGLVIATIVTLILAIIMIGSEM